MFLNYLYYLLHQVVGAGGLFHPLLIRLQTDFFGLLEVTNLSTVIIEVRKVARLLPDCLLREGETDKHEVPHTTHDSCRQS